MSSVDVSDPVITEEQIEEISSIVKSYPQVEPETDHYFLDGMYCRRVFRKAGTVVIGKVHKKAHFFMCAMGSIIVISQNGKRTLHAGDIVECEPNSRKITLALEDSVGVTVHRAQNTKLEEVEKELTEDEPNSMFDIGNILKQEILS